MRRLTAWMPAPLRAAMLLACAVVFFPIIVGVMILGSVAGDLPALQPSSGDSPSHDGPASDSA